MDQEVRTIKALSDQNRLRVIMALTDHEELCVCQITELLNLAMPTVSRHMSVLQNAALVKSRKDSRWVYYRLSEAFPTLCLKWLNQALIDSDDIAEDKKRMKTILSCELEDLCKAQNNRRSSNTGQIKRRKNNG